MAIDKPLLLACWKNTYATTMRVCTVETFNGGTPVDSVAIDLTLALNRDYWFSADGVADDADGNGDFLTIFCDTVISAVTEITNLVPSWSATGRLVLTATLSGATTFNITFEDDMPTGFTAESWARLFGQDEADLEHASVSNVMTFANLSDRIWYVARPLHLDSRDRDNVVGSSSRALDGYAWASIQPSMFVTRTIGWANLKLEHALNEYAATLVPTEPFNTAQNFRDVCVRYARRLRFYPDLSDLGTVGFGVYVPSEPIEDFVTQKDGDDQIFHDAKLMLVRESEVVVVETAGDPPVINSFTLDASAGPIDVRAALLGTFAWNVTGATSLSIDNGVGTVTPVDTGTEDFTMIEGTVVYTLTATNEHGETTAQVSVTGVADVILAQDFDLLYDSKDANSGTHVWPAAIHPGSAGDYEIAHAGDSGNRPSYTFDTGALNEDLAGIGPERVDQAIRLDVSSNSTSGFVGASASQDWTSFYSEVADNLRISMLIYIGAVTNGRRTFSAEDTTVEYFRIASVTSNRFTFSARSDTDGGTTVFTVPTNEFQTVGWHLIEWVFRGNRYDLWHNGAAVADNLDMTNDYRPSVASVRLCLLGAVNGAISEDCGIVFAGIRGLGPSGTYSLAAHQAFAEALGLYTPP